MTVFIYAHDFYSQEECYNGDEREDISMKEFSHLFSPIKVGETVVKTEFLCLLSVQT